LIVKSCIQSGKIDSGWKRKNVKRAFWIKMKKPTICNRSPGLLFRWS
jgi:hypothetical protein